MSWEMHIKMKVEGKPNREFQAIRCSGVNGYTYRYPTKDAAERMIEICYPLTIPEDKRAFEVDEPANMLKS